MSRYDHEQWAQQWALDQAVIPALVQTRRCLASSIVADQLGDEQVGDQWLDRAYRVLDRLDFEQLSYAVVLLLSGAANRDANRLMHVPDIPIRRRPAGR